jgi:hypothetical protein
MDEAILYGHSYVDEETDDTYISVYRGIYDVKSTNSNKRYPAVYNILGINLTRRLIWKGRKHPLKVTEIGDDGFLRIGPFQTCREINGVLTSLGYSAEQIAELLNIIESKSNDPTFKADGLTLSF